MSVLRPRTYGSSTRSWSQLSLILSLCTWEELYTAVNAQGPRCKSRGHLRSGNRGHVREKELYTAANAHGPQCKGRGRFKVRELVSCQREELYTAVSEVQRSRSFKVREPGTCQREELYTAANAHGPQCKGRGRFKFRKPASCKRVALYTDVNAQGHQWKCRSFKVREPESRTAVNAHGSRRKGRGHFKVREPGTCKTKELYTAVNTLSLSLSLTHALALTRAIKEYTFGVFPWWRAQRGTTTEV